MTIHLLPETPPVSIQGIQCLKCGTLYQQAQPCCSNCGHRFGEPIAAPAPAVTTVDRELHGVNGWAVAAFVLNFVPLLVGLAAPGSRLGPVLIVVAFILGVIGYDWAKKHDRVGMSMSAFSLLLSMGWAGVIVYVVVNHSYYLR